MSSKSVQKVILSTAYLPNISYFKQIIKAEGLILESHEHYIKQSYRNRCCILSANGPLNLIIPVKHYKGIITEVKISYQENWQRNHWRAICSAYKNSPYFEFFEDEFSNIYTDRWENLFDYNLYQLKMILKILRLEKKISFTDSFQPNIDNLTDCRNSFSPKIPPTKDDLFLNKAYPQVFDNKLSFKNNLSIIDLLFNQGIKSVDYFK
ncbi:MAG: WbqC family protein [Sphingobacteriaceae bacterium]|nr:WbqC family protein [Sphingobacteriaceae bacterium]